MSDDKKKLAAYRRMIAGARRGGKATGARKARSTSNARKAVRARWAKNKSKRYTHKDGAGMRWRFKGQRPVSELADKVMEGIK